MGESTLSPGPNSVFCRVLAAIGPGIFIIGRIIGRIIGAGSVASMAKAGAEYLFSPQA